MLGRSRFSLPPEAEESARRPVELWNRGSITELIRLYTDRTLHVRPYDRVDPDQYACRLVLGLIGPLAQFGIGMVKEYHDGTPLDFATLTQPVVFVETGQA